ncbi:MAG: DUF1566 domain-containing protein [Treponema sp.]|nr:DUF1566 domain-containing protein [Treponema sp.]MCL2237819.1 DUF1566 domain-containing protein [Treponema sp.]
MKNEKKVAVTKRTVGIIAISVMIVLGLTACAGLSGMFTLSTEPDPIEVGSRGPGGGIVFYDKGNDEGGWQFLEAATTGLGNHLWASRNYYGTNIPTQSGIGTGKANTAAILAADYNSSAINVAVNYRGGGFDDWFMPSIDELAEIYKYAIYFFSLAGSRVWSSTQAPPTNAGAGGAMSFAFEPNGAPSASSKQSSLTVLPIRAFKVDQ